MHLTCRPLTRSDIFLCALHLHLTFCQVEQCRKPQRRLLRQTLLPQHQSQIHSPHTASCVSSSIHQAVLFHCHPTNTLIADINAVTHTSMDVLNLHLILNSGGGGVPHTLTDGGRRVRGDGTLWMCSLSFYSDAGFLDFSFTG